MKNLIVVLAMLVMLPWLLTGIACRVIWHGLYCGWVRAGEYLERLDFI